MCFSNFGDPLPAEHVEEAERLRERARTYAPRSSVPQVAMAKSNPESQPKETPHAEVPKP